MQRVNPIGWAKKIGVNFPDGELHLYGRISWSTEPWIIRLGKNVHITDGVKFLTHDGGCYYLGIEYLTLKLLSQ